MAPPERPRLPPPRPAAGARAFSPRPLPDATSAALAGLPRLYVLYGGRQVAIDKPRWLIGRDPRTADLAIEDAGVSRRHAMVEVVDRRWTMVDLGSTNGVAYNGYRLARKEIVGGDVFVISGHELRFRFE